MLISLFSHLSVALTLSCGLTLESGSLIDLNPITIASYTTSTIPTHSLDNQPLDNRVLDNGVVTGGLIHGEVDGGDGNMGMASSSYYSTVVQVVDEAQVQKLNAALGRQRGNDQQLRNELIESSGKGDFRVFVNPCGSVSPLALPSPCANVDTLLGDRRRSSDATPLSPSAHSSVILWRRSDSACAAVAPLGTERWSESGGPSPTVTATFPPSRGLSTQLAFSCASATAEIDKAALSVSGDVLRIEVATRYACAAASDPAALAARRRRKEAERKAKAKLDAAAASAAAARPGGGAGSSGDRRGSGGAGGSSQQSQFGSGFGKLKELATSSGAPLSRREIDGALKRAQSTRTTARQATPPPTLPLPPVDDSVRLRRPGSSAASSSSVGTAVEVGEEVDLYRMMMAKKKERTSQLSDSRLVAEDQMRRSKTAPKETSTHVGESRRQLRRRVAAASPSPPPLRTPVPPPPSGVREPRTLPPARLPDLAQDDGYYEADRSEGEDVAARVEAEQMRLRLEQAERAARQAAADVVPGDGSPTDAVAARDAAIAAARSSAVMRKVAGAFLLFLAISGAVAWRISAKGSSISAILGLTSASTASHHHNHLGGGGMSSSQSHMPLSSSHAPSSSSSYNRNHHLPPSPSEYGSRATETFTYDRFMAELANRGSKGVGGGVGGPGMAGGLDDDDLDEGLSSLLPAAPGSSISNNSSSSSRAGVAFGDNEEFGVLPEAPGVGGVQRRVARSATPDLWEEPQPDLRPNPHTADLTKKGI